MMRMQIMPGMRFWFHVSVFGFLTVPIFMYAFYFICWRSKEWFPDRILHSYCGGNGDQCCHRSIYPGTGYYPVCRWKHWICLSSILGSYLFAAAEAGVIVYTTVLAHRAIGNKFEKRKKLFPLLLGTVAILTGNLFVALPGNFSRMICWAVFLWHCACYISCGTSICLISRTVS